MRGLFVFATLAVAIPTQAGPVGKRLLLDGGMAVGGVEEAEAVDLSRLTNSEGKTKNEDKYPLLLLPGFTGSSLQSKLTNKRTIWPQCPKNTDGEWPILFLDQSQFEPPEQAVCFLENMKVVVNGGQLLNHEGVEVRPRDWGGVDGLMFQDMHQKIPSYYKHFVETMEKNGWKRGKTLFGAPYDWRYAQLRIDDHYDKMQALIEEIYASTGKPVSIYGHSMGPTVGLAFLHRMTQPWKDRHIAVFMASAPVWTGSVVSVWSAISGLDCKSAFGHDCPGAEGGLGRALLRELADSMPASFATMTLPGDPETDPSTWGKDEVIIKTPSKTYSAHDLHEIMTDLGLKDGAAVQQIVAKDLGATTFKAPLVDTHVYYGFGVPTPSTFEYDVDFAPLKIGEGPPQESKIVRSVDDAGDGVVPLRSTTRTNLTWPAEQEKAGKVLVQKGFKGMVHTNTGPTMADVIKTLNALPNDQRYIARLALEATLQKANVAATATATATAAAAAAAAATATVEAGARGWAESEGVTDGAVMLEDEGAVDVRGI